MSKESIKYESEVLGKGQGGWGDTVTKFTIWSHRKRIIQNLFNK